MASTDFVFEEIVESGVVTEDGDEVGGLLKLFLPILERALGNGFVADTTALGGKSVVENITIRLLERGGTHAFAHAFR